MDVFLCFFFFEKGEKKKRKEKRTRETERKGKRKEKKKEKRKKVTNYPLHEAEQRQKVQFVLHL